MFRHHLYAITAAILLVVFGACRSDSEKVNNGAAGVSDTSTSGTDTSGTTTTDTAVSATTTGSTGGTVSNLSEDDKAFVMKAAQAGMFEVQMGQTAQQKAQSADVKAFGQRMAQDHSKANDELKQLATTKGLALPTDIGDEHKDASQIGSKSGKDFDKSYMNEMVKDHEKAVADFQKAAQNGKDADIKSWAAKTLPTLQDHLNMAKSTQAKVK